MPIASYFERKLQPIIDKNCHIKSSHLIFAGHKTNGDGEMYAQVPPLLRSYRIFSGLVFPAKGLTTMAAGIHVFITWDTLLAR